MANNGGRRRFMVIALSNAKDLKKICHSQNSLLENNIRLVEQISFRSFLTICSFIIMEDRTILTPMLNAFFLKINTIDSGINIGLRLLISGLFSRGYVTY